MLAADDLLDALDQGESGLSMGAGDDYPLDEVLNGIAGDGGQQHAVRYSDGSMGTASLDD